MRCLLAPLGLLFLGCGPVAKPQTQEPAAATMSADQKAMQAMQKRMDETMMPKVPSPLGKTVSGDATPSTEAPIPSGAAPSSVLPDQKK